MKKEENKIKEFLSGTDFTEERKLGYKAGYMAGVEFTQQASNELTKREYMATHILAGIMANPSRYDYIAGRMQERADPLTQEEATQKNVNKALFLADALLKSLSKTE